MKKELILLMLCVTFLSCNSNDDGNTPVNISEQIIGEWSLNRREIDGFLQDLEVCELLTTIIFLESDYFSIELFVGDDAENCQSASNTGIWEYIEEDRISIELTDQVDPTLFRVSFSDSNDKMVLMELDGEEIIRFEEYIRQ